jgi:hypothetical protein
MLDEIILKNEKYRKGGDSHDFASAKPQIELLLFFTQGAKT